MREVPTYIKNFQRVVDTYGYWPSFHDSPVLKFAVDSDTIQLEVKAWEMTSEVDAKGYFVLTKKHNIGFIFTGLVSTELDAFIPENILYDLGFTPLDEHNSQGYFNIELDSAMGSDLCGRFSATVGEVTHVTPSED